MTPPREKVLIIGAAGRVGRALTAAWKDRFDLTLLDILPLPDDNACHTVHGDLCDAALMKSLCGQHTVIVNLAIEGNLQSPEDMLARVNTQGALDLFNIADQAGCRRTIFASSLSILLHPDQPYSLSKKQVEEGAAAYAKQSRMSIHCLRLGAVKALPLKGMYPWSYSMSFLLTHGDLVQLFTRSVEACQNLHFGIFPGVSLNGLQAFDLSESMEKLGYAPKDDALEYARRNRWTPRGFFHRLRRFVLTGK